MQNLYGSTRSELEAAVRAMGLPAYRGRQIYHWMYGRRATSFEEMTELPKRIRDSLEGRCEIRRPRLLASHPSSDGTVKHQIGLSDSRRVECVYIPETFENDASRARHTFCLSTQVGCPLKCSFCFSGTIRLERNVTVGEILGQFQLARAAVTQQPARSNIVFMGMGEPLLNLEAVTTAIDILTDDQGFGLSPRRITVSTAGLANELERFVRKAPRVGLAISLHATTNELRDPLMPINRKYSLEEVLRVARELPIPKRRRITFEYVLLGGQNDRPEDARRLATLLRGIPAKVNLIDFNPWPGSPHRRSTEGATQSFLTTLRDRGLTANRRRSRGEDVLAACGQLANAT